MKPTKRILFLSHSASRNGATILLLHFLRWLRDKTDYRIEVLVNGSGELLDEFRAVAPTTAWRSPTFLLEAFPRRWRAAWRPRLEAQCLKAFLAGRRYDLVYANTAATWRQVAFLARRTRGLLWHIHELGYALRLTMGEESIRQLFPLAARFIAVSNPVWYALVKEFGVSEQKVDLVHEFVPIPSLSSESRALKRQLIRQRLGWPDTSFVVGGCGSLGWRKGTDVFLQIARKMQMETRDKPIRFLWVGGAAEDKEMLEYNHDVRALGLQGHCCCVPSTADVLDYYSAMDVFALPSREDPFPLVMLEAGAQGLPVVCFAGSGGAVEFIGQDAGLVAPYLDVQAFAAHLVRLHDDPHLRGGLGAQAARKVRTLYSLEVQAPKLLQSIERCLASA